MKDDSSIATVYVVQVKVMFVKFLQMCIKISSNRDKQTDSIGGMGFVSILAKTQTHPMLIAL